MQIYLKIAQPQNAAAPTTRGDGLQATAGGRDESQGVPALDIPNRKKRPKKVSLSLPYGETNTQVPFEKDDMSAYLNLTVGVESYSTKHKVKWGESSPMASRSSGATYGSTGLARDTLPKITLSAYELSKTHDLVEGANRLLDVLDWLEYCTVPWTTYGQPPLLAVVIGQRTFYGYLEEFDPVISDWLPDNGGKDPASGLPYEVNFNLTFVREPLGYGVFAKKKLGRKRGQLPYSRQLTGGQGGVGLPDDPTNGRSASDSSQTVTDRIEEALSRANPGATTAVAQALAQARSAPGNPLQYATGNPDAQAGYGGAGITLPFKPQIAPVVISTPPPSGTNVPAPAPAPKPAAPLPPAGSVKAIPLAPAGGAGSVKVAQIVPGKVGVLGSGSGAHHDESLATGFNYLNEPPSHVTMMRRSVVPMVLRLLVHPCREYRIGQAQFHAEVISDRCLYPREPNPVQSLQQRLSRGLMASCHLSFSPWGLADRKHVQMRYLWYQSFSSDVLNQV